MLTTIRKKPTFFNFPIEDAFREFDNLLEKNNSFQRIKSNFLEKNDSFVLEMLIPGIKKEELDVSLENYNLTVEFIKDESKEEELDKYTMKEFSFKSFKRSFVLPKNSNIESITSKLENGILYIKIPKVLEESKNKKVIEII